eukprot:gb/GECG01001971.1/.p1 GENE.gb/GECG01001971.1/~~gb/GECG01001971.1/.p1  ORF type:complete len:173 (+),score=7.02 gb/GECG01001971.1/:1-519(+)
MFRNQKLPTLLTLVHAVNAVSVAGATAHRATLLARGKPENFARRMTTMSFEARNVFGEPLQPCGYDPMTGFYRDGFCRTGPRDFGSHTVCAIVTDEFLEDTKRRGNDLSTPRPQFGFPGLKDGDAWCLCASRWYETYMSGVAPSVVLESTHEKALQTIPLETLQKFRYDKRQ